MGDDYQMGDSETASLDQIRVSSCRLWDVRFARGSRSVDRKNEPIPRKFLQQPAR